MTGGLQHPARQRAVLNDGDRVLVVGGGPAGSFFAIDVLRECRKLGRRIELTIIEKKRLLEGQDDPWLCRGCNFCAGGISPRLNDILEQDGLPVPRQIICEEFRYLWIQGHWKNFRLRVPHGSRLYSVFRGSLPAQKEDPAGGLDAFLLKQAMSEGARFLQAEVQRIESAAGSTRLRMAPGNGPEALEAEFVAVAPGINMDLGRHYAESELIRSISAMNPRFVPAQTRKTLIFEMRLGRDYLTRYINNELHFIEFGSREVRLEHIALLPKGDYLTVVLIGKSIDDADLPRQVRPLVTKFLALPHIRRVLPHLDAERAPIACHCSPWMAVTPAKAPFAERVALIGDTVGSRLYKDGLYSAYVTARQLAMTVLHEGVDEQSLRRGYAPAVRWLATDNRFGRLVFGVSGLAFRKPFLSRVLYQAFATERKVKDASKRPLDDVLWMIASGAEDFREVFRWMFSLPVLRSVLVGGLLITIRNILTEAFFGLRWGDFGRYPTVVLKERREDLKRQLSAKLGVALDESPDFERMYAIKIRASAEQVFRELGKFGDESGNFLRLRFAGVRRIAGDPNRPGVVVRYEVRWLGLSIDLKLTHCLPETTLLYEVSGNLARSGKLIFDINPTEEGNQRCAIYAAFDFQRGRTAPGRLFRTMFKLLFPSYVHDVVWNHALCCIKEQVEASSAADWAAPAAGVSTARIGG